MARKMSYENLEKALAKFKTRNGQLESEYFTLQKEYEKLNTSLASETRIKEAIFREYDRETRALNEKIEEIKHRHFNDAPSQLKIWSGGNAIIIPFRKRANNT